MYIREERPNFQYKPEWYGKTMVVEHVQEVLKGIHELGEMIGNFHALAIPDA